MPCVINSQPLLNVFFDIAKEKGASSWLSFLPITQHGFNFHKGAFRDGLCLRNGLRPPSLPDLCVCGKSFSIEHALSSLHGGFSTLRYDDLRNITAKFLSLICSNVVIEPTLQPLNGELI